jgi:PAS domain S-box-containing protein
VPLQTPHEEPALLTQLPADVRLHVGTDGRWTAASSAVEWMLGYQPEALVGRPAAELVDAPERVRAERAVRAALAVSDTLTLELPLVRLDGTVIRADVRFNRVRDSDGGYRVTVRGAGDRRRSDALAPQFELLFKTTRRGIAVTDARTGLVVAVNPAYAAMHGGVVPDFTGRPLISLPAAGAADRVARLAAEIDETGFLSYESEHVRADGSTFPAAVEVVAVRDERGEQTFWLAWVKDVTERRRAEDAAARSVDEMARSNADLDRFAAVVSHDLQSPLRVIAGCARLLERSAGERLGEFERELLGHVVAGTNRMTRLLDGIREYSRAGGGSGALQIVDTRDAVDEALAALRGELDASGAIVRVGPMPMLAGHSAGLAQLFQNLIGNAVKFRSAAPPEIEIAAEPGEGEWVFTVADNGIGIDPRHAADVFEFGHRLHGEDEVPGTGIGLAVCKAVVERHGGRISVAPRPGGGSCFRFTLSAPAA